MDYREFVVCLRILENFDEVAKKARNMLLRFYDMWATERSAVRLKLNVETCEIRTVLPNRMSYPVSLNG